MQVLGSECPNCKKFYNLVRNIASELHINEPIDYIDDLREIIKIGVMTPPALLVNGKTALTGSYHSAKDIKKALSMSINSPSKEAPENNSSGCSSCAAI